MKDTDWARGLITLGIVAIFAYAYAQQPHDDMMKGALIAAFAGAANYWLGSSKGSDDKTKALIENQDGEPQPVRVTNPPSQPVPTTEWGPPSPPPIEPPPPAAPATADSDTPVVE